MFDNFVLNLKRLINKRLLSLEKIIVYKIILKCYLM